MTVATARRMTLKKYLTYDDGTDSRYELVDGVLVEMGNEAKINTLIAGFLFEVFIRLGLPAYRIGFKQKIQVYSEYVSARDPDLIVHSVEAAAGEDDSEFCLKLGESNPLITIEVVSPGEPGTPNYDRDYEHKPCEYAARGIPEMWQVDPARAWVKVGTLIDRAYAFETFRGGDAIVSPGFTGLKVTAIEVLKAGR
jgi:Uma2 family endonuclease